MIAIWTILIVLTLFGIGLIIYDVRSSLEHQSESQVQISVLILCFLVLASIVSIILYINTDSSGMFIFPTLNKVVAIISLIALIYIIAVAIWSRWKG